jgi:hypothetical protein
MYLESSSEKNNGYYQKFGFEIKREVYLGTEVAGTGGPGAAHAPVRLTIMVREPRQMSLAHSIPIKLHSGFSHRGAL